MITTEADIEKIKLQAKNLAIRAFNVRSEILKDVSGNNVNINLLVVISKDGKEEVRREIEDELQ